MARIVSYKFRETDQTVWISGSGGSSASIAADVAAIKLPDASFDALYNLRIVGLNNTIGYVTGENMVIPISSSEELWVYRGYQPIGAGDRNAYNYNPYFHRPYKIYSVVSTQSGVPANPWLPSGSVQFQGTGPSSQLGQLGGGGLGFSQNTTNQFFQTQFDMIEAAVLAEVGNPTTQSYTTESISGSFEVFHPSRNVSPYVWTRYIGGAYNPPAFGAQFMIRAQSGDDSGSNYSLTQEQGGSTNTSPFKYDSVNLPRGVYSWTSSQFDNTGVNGGDAFGSTVFGLFCNYGNYVEYRAINDSTSTSDMRIFYTASNLTSSYFDLIPDTQCDFPALAGTVSSSGLTATLPGSSFTKINSVQASGNTVPDYFAYKIDKVYASYSSSLSSSLDGLYVFNQVPQTNIQLTSSIKVDAWTGSDPSTGAVYGATGSLYGTSSFGAGELGDGDTWPTCSIKIFKGNYPNYVPEVDITGSLISTISQSILTQSTFHVTQGAPTEHTMSYMITESVYYRDCLSMAVMVSSGSAASSSVQNALFVKDYYMEFKNEPLVDGDGLVPTNLEGAFSGSIPFAFADDCQPFLNNINNDRRGGIYYVADYSYGIYSPINFDQIISRSAEYAEVQDSNYTTARIVLPRYDGSQTTAFNLNSTDGLQGGYGLPVIDYLSAYFGYANEVSDPYPVINGITQANIKYLVDGSGRATQPNLSPWAAFDLQSTYAISSTELVDTFFGGQRKESYESKARIAINPDEQQTQYLTLNGIKSLFKVAQRVEPILYSQTSSANFTPTIPMAGFAGTVSDYVSTFTDFSLTAGGTAWGGDRMSKQFSRTPLAASGSYTKASAGTIGANVLQTSSTFSNPYAGVLKFEDDALYTGTVPGGLSDDYFIGLNYLQPSTRPRTYKVSGGSWNKKSVYDKEVGYIKVKLQSSTDINFGSITNEPLSLWSTPMMKFWFGNQSDGDYIILTMASVFGGSNVNINNSTNEFNITINTDNIENIVQQQGRNYDDCTFVEFGIGLRTSTTLYSTKYYRWSTECFYEDEPYHTEKKNWWNPTATSSPTNDYPAIVPPVYPTTTIKIIGTMTGQSSVDNALNSPFWYFPFTDITGSALADPTTGLDIIQLTGSNGNSLYGNSIQKTLPYTAASSSYFPGNLEPEDTTWPQQRLGFNVQIGDEIRFENNESETYKIIKVTSPQENESLTSQSGNGKYELRLQVDRPITPSVNLNFFLLRRYVDDASTILIDTDFPYPGVGSETTEFVISPGQSGSQGYYPASGSYISVPPGKLTKKQLTTSAIVFPVFPTEDINTEPDLLLDALRNNKLID